MKRLLQKLIFFFSILFLTATASYSSFTLQNHSTSDKEIYCLKSEIIRQPACILSSLHSPFTISGSESADQQKKDKAAAFKNFILLQGILSSTAQAEEEKYGPQPLTPLFVFHRQLRL